jgi:antitoxin component of MazEF toxin-antitoxin module
MKFALYRTTKDCNIPSTALAVAGLKREKELRLEADNGLIIILRPKMDAKRLLAISEYLDDLSARMVEAVAAATGDCSCCGDCHEDEHCECDYCGSRERCRGIELPDCLLEQAGIGKDCGLQSDVADGIITIRALDDDADEGDMFPDEVPESARGILHDCGVCIPNLRKILCSNDSIPF